MKFWKIVDAGGIIGIKSMRHITRQQAAEIDRVARERYGIPVLLLMENAARAVAEEACDLLDNDCVGEILILCGAGNNGGDGLATARHLHNRGADVKIMLTADAGKYQEAARVNYEIARAMRLAIEPATAHEVARCRPMLVIDAIFGTGLKQRPREPFEEIARAAMGLGAPVLAVDIPSGMDCDTGEALSPRTIQATRTVSFVAAKAGFPHKNADRYTGEVVIGDIGCPRELIEEVIGRG